MTHLSLDRGLSVHPFVTQGLVVRLFPLTQAQSPAKSDKKTI